MLNLTKQKKKNVDDKSDNGNECSRKNEDIKMPMGSSRS